MRRSKPLSQPSRGGDRQWREAVVRQPVNVLTWRCQPREEGSWDRFVQEIGSRGGPLKLHLRPSRDHIVGDLEEPGTASASLSGVGPRSDGRGETAGEGPSEPEEGSGRYGIFLTGRVVSFRWGDGRLQGQVERIEV
jgi:hypothetical protein